MEFEPKAAFEELGACWRHLQTSLAWRDLAECELQRSRILHCEHSPPTDHEIEDIRNHYDHFVFLAEQIARALNAADVPPRAKHLWQRELDLWVRHAHQLRIAERFISH